MKPAFAEFAVADLELPTRRFGSISPNRLKDTVKVFFGDLLFEMFSGNNSTW